MATNFDIKGIGMDGPPPETRDTYEPLVMAVPFHSKLVITIHPRDVMSNDFTSKITMTWYTRRGE